MRYPRFTSRSGRPLRDLAGVFVDYDNVFALLDEQFDDEAVVDEVLLDVVDELRRHLLDEFRVETAFAYAYSDFTSFGSRTDIVLRSLHQQGIEPRVFPRTLQDNESELHLCVEAMAACMDHNELSTIVVLTGNRYYLPLLQHLQRAGISYVLATLEPLPTTKHVPFLDKTNLIDGNRLVSDEARAQMVEPTELSADYEQNSREDIEYLTVTSEPCLRTLEIVEEFFGQYDEVYLTPLLRKLSELLEEDGYDPKTLINELEEAGAVYLEKRRGFPYDYTVLIVDEKHPQVDEIRQTFYEHNRSEPDYDDNYPSHDDDFGRDDFDHESYASDFNYREPMPFEGDGERTEATDVVPESSFDKQN